MMSSISGSEDLNSLNEDKESSFFKKKSMDYTYYRSDIVDIEKNIPNLFIPPDFNESDIFLDQLSVLKRESNIPNIFNVDALPENSTCTSNYADKFYEYPDLFKLHKSYSELYGVKSAFWEQHCNYTNVFSLSDIQHIECVQHLEINNSYNEKQENNDLIANDKLLHESSSEVNSDINKLEVNNTAKNCSVLEENDEENMSSALSFWCVITGANMRHNNIKTYFPQKEINSECIMKDIKLMLTNMGSTYFFVDEETQMFILNGNISITGLTPEMYESATDPVLECANLYKMLCTTIIKWKESCDDSIVKALIFAISNILDDYERAIYSVPDESLLSLVDRLSYIIPRLKLLSNICCLKIRSGIITPGNIPCGIKVLNVIHGYLFDYRFSHDLFLKMLLYMFESCCLAYFRILSNWALRGVLNSADPGMFIQLKPDIEDEDMSDCSRNNWNCFIIDENIESPIFLNKYKEDILCCGKTINFFKKFNDLNVFLPDITCCFDSVDTQKVYEQFSTYFKYDSGLKISNCVKTMSNCYLFESAARYFHRNNNLGSNDIKNINSTNVTESDKMYSNNENYEFFQTPDWTTFNNAYEFSKPHGFFTTHNDCLTYNGKPFDVINMIDYVPHSLLIPARIQKSVCDKEILDLFFVQENLMGCLYRLSQCFFFMNWRFSSKLCETLFDGIINNRNKPLNIFNPAKLKSIVDEASQDSFSENDKHNFTLEQIFIPRLCGVIDISDVECIELNYTPEWPMNMILSNKLLIKYRKMFLFANKLEYVSWSLLKARELLSVYKNDTGLQFRQINLFKHWMNQFVAAMQQYYKQVVISSCWSELNKKLENVKNYDELFTSHKQYMHNMFKHCLMIVGFKDKHILLNEIYVVILAYYRALVSGQFYMENSERLHSEFISMERAFSRFVELREMFYTSVLKTVRFSDKHCLVQMESLIAILGPSCNSYS